MTITADPRERLVIAGSKVLDASFKEQQFENKYAEILKVLRDKKRDDDNSFTSALDTLEGDEKTDFLMGMLMLGHERQAAVKEYVLIREMNESFDQPRQDISGL